jgi:hypothetical protein
MAFVLAVLESTNGGGGSVHALCTRSLAEAPLGTKVVDFAGNIETDALLAIRSAL